MKSFPFTTSALALGLALFVPTVLRAQDHGHLNAGALSKGQGAPLYFANGPDFIATSGYVKTLAFTNAGRFAGYYQQNITLTALPVTALNFGPDPNAAALGSFLQFSLSCLEGPDGGSFGFWDVGSVAPSLSLAPGQVSTSLWRVSEGDGLPGSDPFGHIHGRRFTATKPGFYKVGFTLFDTSTNGAGGGEIHTPSAEFPVYFQAGVNVHSIEPDEDHTHIRFPAPVGNTWQVEACDSLTTNTVWTAVGNPVVGNDYLHEVEDDEAVQGNRFYRLRGTAP